MMANNSRYVLRIKKDIMEVMKTEDEFLIELVDDNVMDLIAKIPGPPDTPYEKGIFTIAINLSKGYPFSSPKVRFITKILHPNISSGTGSICLDNFSINAWTPSMTLRTILLSLQGLMAQPLPDDLRDIVVANQFKNNNQLFQLPARYWAQVYAKAKGSMEDCDEKVNQLIEMGVSQDRAIMALSSSS